MNYMILFELLLYSAIGIVCVILGVLIWKKEQITLIHSYHYENVSDKDKKSYTAKIGKAMIVLGVGLCLTGMINTVFKTQFGLFAFGISFIIMLVMVIQAQSKYNK